MTQPTLFDAPKPFRGKTFDAKRDGTRLTSLYDRVKSYMASHGWVTLAELSAACGGSEASVSARLRDMQSPKFDDLKVEKEYVERGLWRYRLVREAA